MKLLSSLAHLHRTLHRLLDACATGKWSFHLASPPGGHFARPVAPETEPASHRHDSHSKQENMLGFANTGSMTK
jgi:hypothetical protein